MDRNREAFRNRFLAYKNGKSVNEIYNIPSYKDGKLPKYEDGKGKSILKILTSPFQFLRDHMYKTVSPSGYTTEQISNFIKGKKRTRFQDPNTEAMYGLYTKQDSVNTQLYEDFLKNNNIPYKIVGKDEYGDPILRVAVKDIIKPSVYKKGAYEFRYPNLPGQYPLVPKGTVGDKKWVHSHMLGGYHKGTQKDETGTYDYYEDKWDINPFKGQSANNDGSTLFKAGNKIGLGYFDDIVPWGNPVDIYGRVYQKQK